MGGLGTSSAQQNQVQQSQTNPWAPAQPVLQGILGQLQGQLPNTGITQPQSNAIGTIENNAANTNQFTPAINNVTGSLLAGGGANNQSPFVQSAYNTRFNNTAPLANNTNYDPYSTPGFSDALKTATSDITNNINGYFAGAGRDLSGANAQALSRGLAQGLAPMIQSQYQNNVTNQQNAAGNLYGAATNNAGILSGLQQQFLTNQQAGVNGVSAGLDASNAGSNATIQAEAARLGIPLTNLGLVSNIGIPIAGLGGQSSGSSNTNTTQTMSPIQQFMGLTSGLGNIGLKFSDRRLKDDVEQVGALFDGTPVYRYRYKGHVTFELGLLAQDVEKYAPEAVGDVGGFKAVNYKLATDKALGVG
jgi:hypothetical protein